MTPDTSIIGPVRERVPRLDRLALLYFPLCRVRHISAHSLRFVPLDLCHRWLAAVIPYLNVRLKRSALAELHAFGISGLKFTAWDLIQTRDRRVPSSDGATP